MADELEKHTTGDFGITYAAPAGWPVTEQEMQGSRQLYVAVDPSDPDSANVVLTLQPLAADYTGLGSFGTAELVSRRTRLLAYATSRDRRGRCARVGRSANH